MRRQIVAPIDGVTAFGLEIPFAELTQLDVFHPYSIEVLHQCFLSLLEVKGVEAVAIGMSLSIIGERGGFLSDVESQHKSLCEWQLRGFACLGIDTKDVLAVSILAEGVNHAVRFGPLP